MQNAEKYKQRDSIGCTSMNRGGRNFFFSGRNHLHGQQGFLRFVSRKLENLRKITFCIVYKRKRNSGLL
jgi:hypothetical protein